MAKRLTVRVSDDVYRGLHKVVGRRRIGRFLEDLARPHVTPQALDAEYQAMAADQAREREAAEWREGLCGDVSDGLR